MKKIILAMMVIVSLCAGSAYARNDGNENGAGCTDNCGEGRGGTGGAVDVNAAAAAAALAFTNSKQFQEAVAAAVQKNQQSLSLQQFYSADPGRDNTPSFALGSLYPSAPCMGTSNAGGSGPGFSVGFGTSWESVKCNFREAARMAPTEADKVYVWCQLEEAKGAPSCVKIEAQKKAEAARTLADSQQAPKPKTTDDRPADVVSVAQKDGGWVWKNWQWVPAE